MDGAEECRSQDDPEQRLPLPGAVEDSFLMGLALFLSRPRCSISVPQGRLTGILHFSSTSMCSKPCGTDIVHPGLRCALIDGAAFVVPSDFA